MTTRPQAINNGDKTYDTGKPCKFGHVSPRYAANHTCLECSLTNSRNYDAVNLELRRQRRHQRKLSNPNYYRSQHLKRKYGLSAADFDSLFESQKGMCWICEVAMTRGNTPTSACVDHCHSSGAIRSLLCRLCNAGLGHFKDSEANLTKAITYLRRHQNAS